MKQLFLLLSKIIVLILLQVWLFNNLYLFRVATPFPYLYILFLLPMNLSKLTSVGFCALFGLVLDILSGTPGLHMATFPATALFRCYLLSFFSRAEIDWSQAPSLHCNGWRLILMMLLLVLFHHLFLFLLDAFLSFDIVYFLTRFLGSVCSTFLILLIALLFGGRILKKNFARSLP